MLEFQLGEFGILSTLVARSLDKNQERKVNVLRKLLQQMLDECAQKYGAVVRRKLKGNLHVAMVMTVKDVQISLSRDKVYPSASEWKTTLANFPYYVPQVAPISFVDSERRYAMRAKLPRREDVPQQLGLEVAIPGGSSETGQKGES